MYETKIRSARKAVKKAAKGISQCTTQRLGQLKPRNKKIAKCEGLQSQKSQTMGV